jgi:flagellar motor switch protein FliM
MRQDFAFVAERALASHSPALLRPGPADADLIEALRQAAARLSRALRGALARLGGGEAADVAIAPPYQVAFADFPRDGLTAYSLYSAAPSGERLLSAIDAEAVLRLVDRAFGGPGEAPHPLPRELPMSAELMVQRIETILATQLGLALGSTTAGRPAIHPLRHDSDLAQLQPFAPATRLAVLDIAVSEGLRAPWPIRVAIPLSALPVLTGIVPAPVAGRFAARARASAQSADRPASAAGDRPARDRPRHDRRDRRSGRHPDHPTRLIISRHSLDQEATMTFTTRGFDLIKDVDVRLTVELGRTDMKLKDVLGLTTDSVVVLDRMTDELLDVMVNGKLIARGEVITQGERFGLRIVELVGQEAPAAPEEPRRRAAGKDQ